MNKEIIIDKENFSRSKKKLKNILKEKGVTLSLSETAEILAQVFGFRNEHDMNKNYFQNKQSDLNSKPSNESEAKRNRPDFDLIFNDQKMKELIVSLKNNNGLTLISGKTNSGKTTLMNKINQISGNEDERIISYEAPINFMLAHDQKTLVNLAEKSKKQPVFLIFWKQYKNNEALKKYFQFHFDIEVNDHETILTVFDFIQNKQYKFVS